MNGHGHGGENETFPELCTHTPSATALTFWVRANERGGPRYCLVGAPAEHAGRRLFCWYTRPAQVPWLTPVQRERMRRLETSLRRAYENGEEHELDFLREDPRNPTHHPRARHNSS